MKQFYSTVQLAKRLGVAEHRITYAHRVGKLADSSYLIGRQRIYTEHDLSRIAEYFGVVARKESHAK